MPSDRTYPRDPGEPEAPGLPESIRLWLSAAAGYVHARLELFGLEAKGAAVNYVQIVILLICSVVFLVFGYVFLVLAVAFLVAFLFHWNWGWITLGFGVGHLVLTGACLWLAKTRFSVAGFPSTIAEFKKDKEWLSQKNTPIRSATLSAVRTS
jgi:uncharacterized membrane protein YqjE